MTRIYLSPEIKTERNMSPLHSLFLKNRSVFILWKRTGLGLAPDQDPLGRDIGGDLDLITQWGKEVSLDTFFWSGMNLLWWIIKIYKLISLKFVFLNTLFFFHSHFSSSMLIIFR